MRRTAKVRPACGRSHRRIAVKAPALSHFRYVPGRVFAFHLVRNAGFEPATFRFGDESSSTELKNAWPIATCAPLSLRCLLGDEIQHVECRSPAGYLTDREDAGCSPEPWRSAQARLLAKLALSCAIRYPSRLTTLVKRVAPPRVLSLACVTGPVPGA